MGMSIKQLRAFLAVAHTLNFAHASERLNMSQPALSLAIKGLEESLGGALLLRTTRKVTLTQEGETLLTMGRQLLADWENTATWQNFDCCDAVICRECAAAGAQDLSRQLCRCQCHGARRN